MSETNQHAKLVKDVKQNLHQLVSKTIRENGEFLFLPKKTEDKKFACRLKVLSRETAISISTCSREVISTAVLNMIIGFKFDVIHLL